jgi:hypothetical protein
VVRAWAVEGGDASLGGLRIGVGCGGKRVGYAVEERLDGI